MGIKATWGFGAMKWGCWGIGTTWRFVSMKCGGFGIGTTWGFGDMKWGGWGRLIGIGFLSFMILESPCSLKEG